MSKKRKAAPNTPVSPEPAVAPATPTFLTPLLVLIITFLCYLPALRNGFVNWDDEATILNNPTLTDAGGHIFSLTDGSAGLGNYNPLTILSFYVEKKLAGGQFSPLLIHLNNVLLHLLTVWLVMQVLPAMGIGRVGAAVGGLLFGIHPMRVESVAWATERKDVLFAVFFFAALLCYMRWRKAAESGARRPGLYGWAIALGLLSLLAKVQAVALPLALLTLDYWARRPFTLRSVVVEKAPFWVLAAIFGGINLYTLRLAGATNPVDFSLLQRLGIGAYSLCVYLYKLVLPFPMLPLYPYPLPLPGWMYAMPLVALALAAGFWWLHRSGQRAWVFGALFFLVNIVFLLQLLTAGQGFLADRFTYVAYFGFFAVAGFYVEKYAQQAAWKSRLAVGLVALTAIYALATYLQIGVWKDSNTLWSHAIKYTGDRSALPHWYRGQYLRSQGQFDAALADYQNALSLEPQNPELLNSRGKTYFDLAMSGKQPREKAADYLRQALADYDQSLRLADRVGPAVKAAMLINRGALLGTLNRLEAALQDFNDGLALDPLNKNGYLNRGSLFLKMQQREQALADFNRYLQLEPGNARVREQRAKLEQALREK